MANDWTETTLGEVVELKRGYDLPTRQRNPGRIPIVSSSGISGTHSESKVAGPGVVTGRYGTIGQVFYIEEDFWPLNTTLYVRDFKGNHPKFINYFLTSIHYLAYSDKAAVPGVNRNHLHQAKVRIPSPPTQKRIADILGTLDNKIELNRQINETLEAMARRLFRSWLVDFDPVHAKAALRRQHPKLTGAELSRRALPNLAPEIAELFPDSFEDSPLGPIPKGWSAGTVPEVIEVNPSRSLKKGTRVAWLEMSNMPTRLARATAWQYRDFKSGTKFINGDTLVARITPCLENGKTAFVDFLADGDVAAGSTEYIVLRPKEPLPPVFAYLLARTEDFRSHLISNMTGTSGRQRAPADCLKSYPLVVPSESIARNFARLTQPLFAQMKSNDEESAELASIRDKLLPRLLSGELVL